MNKRKIVHVEIPTSDSSASGKFYGDLFGWEINSMPEMDYIMVNSGNVGGGFSKVDPEGEFPVKPGDVLIYIGSEDIDADLKKAEKLGGKLIVPKMEIPQTGWFGVFQDVSGNQIGLFTGMEE